MEIWVDTNQDMFAQDLVVANIYFYEQQHSYKLNTCKSTENMIPYSFAGMLYMHNSADLPNAPSGVCTLKSTLSSVHKLAVTSTKIL